MKFIEKSTMFDTKSIIFKSDYPYDILIDQIFYKYILYIIQIYSKISFFVLFDIKIYPNLNELFL